MKKSGQFLHQYWWDCIYSTSASNQLEH